MKDRKIQHFFPAISISTTIIIMGFTFVTAQILIIRELITIFYGNELSIGTMLGTWLFWTGIGSILLPGLFLPKFNPAKRAAGVHLLLSVIIPFLLFSAVYSKNLLPLSSGEMIGFIPMLIISQIVLAPFCLLAGLYYTISCQWAGKIISNDSESIAKVYLWEAIGAGLGGIISSLILVKFIQPFQILIFLSSVNLLCYLYHSRSNPSIFKSLKSLYILLIPFLLLTIGLINADKIQSLYNNQLWKNSTLIKRKNTPHGNITVTKINSQISLFHNGLHLFTIPDKLTAEESVHYSLLEHTNPENILLIGGNVQESIYEALKHPSVKNVTYIELDPLIIKYALQYQDKISVKDPRIKIVNIDGRLFIKKCRKKYDAIILNLPDPFSAQLNRFYTIEFFREVKNILHPNGLFSLTVHGSENVIGPELSEYLSVIASGLKKVFPSMIFIPGETIHIIASSGKKNLTLDPQILLQRLKQRNIQTQYIREYYLPYQMSKERCGYLKSRLHSVEDSRLNKDFHPIGYYYNTLLWSVTYMSLFKKIFLFAAKINLLEIIFFIAAIVSLITIICLYRKNNQSLSSWGIGLSIICVGFSEIAIEVILILSFQILYGHVYHLIALIIAGYMTGLALGGRASFSSKISNFTISKLFFKLQFFMFIFPFFLAGLLYLFHHFFSITFNSTITTTIFTFLIVTAGFAGGLQFALANHLLFKIKKSIRKTASFLYSLDLFGSSAGALLTGALLIPIFGIHQTLMFLGAINFTALTVLYINLRLKN